MSAKEAKREMVKDFEKAFGSKVEDVINKEGLDYFWDERTEVMDAFEMLKSIGKIVVVKELVDKMFDEGDSSTIKVVVRDSSGNSKQTDEKLNSLFEKSDTSAGFVVYRLGEQLGNTFKTFDSANKFAVKTALEHGFQRTELQILEIKGFPVFE